MSQEVGHQLEVVLGFQRYRESWVGTFSTLGIGDDSTRLASNTADTFKLVILEDLKLIESVKALVSHNERERYGVRFEPWSNAFLTLYTLNAMQSVEQ